MATIIPDNHAQVAQTFVLNGAPHPFVVVTGHRWEGIGDADDIAQAVRNGWFTWWDDFTRSSNWTLGNTKALYRTPTGLLTVGESLVSNVGTGTTFSAVPPNSCILVKKKTNLAGRKFRGRMFVPCWPIGEGNVSEAGVVDAAVLTQVQNAVNVMVSQWLTDDAPPVLLHSDTTAPTNIVSHVADGRLATQRRRLRS